MTATNVFARLMMRWKGVSWFGPEGSCVTIRALTFAMRYSGHCARSCNTYDQLDHFFHSLYTLTSATDTHTHTHGGRILLHRQSRLSKESVVAASVEKSIFSTKLTISMAFSHSSPFRGVVVGGCCRSCLVLSTLTHGQHCCVLGSVGGASLLDEIALVAASCDRCSTAVTVTFFDVTSWIVFKFLEE